MLVLEHFTHAGARVLTIRADRKVDELFDRAKPGDKIYTVPDARAYPVERLVRALQHCPAVEV